MILVKIKSTPPMNKPTITDIIMTISVSLVVSLLVGQTTFKISVLTSLKKVRGVAMRGILPYKCSTDKAQSD